MVFDILQSRVSEDALAEFLAKPIDKDLTSVPGIGPANMAHLNDNDIFTTHQLIGVYLVGMNGYGNCLDEFWKVLNDYGIKSYRTGIVHAVAEKVNIMIPGTFTSS